MKPRPSIGRMGHTGLMPHIDELHLLACGDGERFIQMVSNERKRCAGYQAVRWS
jgi:hypothetical protein